ncbi:MAG: hypothetical protein JXP73_08790 [Deltaproteobacteria bacterium]|nr:hypothetical protein [Deltaproteobacteria bacterium]
MATLAGGACSSGGLRKLNVDASASGGGEPGTGGVVIGGATGAGGNSVVAVGGAAGTGGMTGVTATGGNGGLGGQGGRDAAATEPQEGGGADHASPSDGRDNEPAGDDAPLLGAGGVPARDVASGGGSGLGGSPEPDAGTGGVGGAAALDAGFPGMGGALGDFCEGAESKVEYGGRTFVVPATSKYTDHGASCCFAVAATLHTFDDLGRDIDAVVTFQTGYRTTGMATVAAGSSGPVWAAVRTLLHSDSSGRAVDVAMTGSVWLSDVQFASQPWTLGLCLSVEDATSPLQGTKVYVPGVTVGAGEWASRLRLWLLRDKSITAVDAERANLDGLELAGDPLLDLMQVAFVELESTTRSYFEDTPCMWVGLDTQRISGATLKSEILGPGASKVDLAGVPFVLEADGQRIYLGAFATLISSIGSYGPQVYVENIDDDGFPIYPPSSFDPKPPDPRMDPRILKVLGEAGKSFP